MSEPGTFECVCCGGTFYKSNSDAESDEQFARDFPDHERGKDDPMACEVCYRAGMRGMRK